MKKITIQDMYRLAQERGGKCHADEYINSATKLLWECSLGHRWTATPSKISMGRWCPVCGGSQVLTIKEMRDIAESRGGKCLSVEYVNIKTHLLWECSKKHRWKAVPFSIKRGSWCPECAGTQKHNIEMMKALAKSRGGECLSDSYVNNSTALEWKCSEGHHWESAPNKIRSGRWCPECSSSLGERLCKVFFEDVFDAKFPRSYPEWLVNDSGNRMELDGYCDDLRVAFEHHGEQHYSLTTHFIKTKEKLIVRQDLDEQKRKLCEENGVVLIEVPEIKMPFKADILRKALIEIIKSSGIKIPIGLEGKDIDWDRAYVSGELKELVTIAAERGGECLAKKYKGSLTPIEWKCSEGHIWKATPSSIRSGSWCFKCSYVIRADNLRKDFSEILQYALNKGGKCLSPDYQNTSQKLLWECEYGHQWDAAFSNIRAGKWCPICAGTLPLTISEMKEMAQSRGGKCLSGVYVNARTKLEWECEEGHKWFAVPMSVKKGHWCPVCSGVVTLDISVMQTFAKSKMGRLISEKYFNSSENLVWECNNGHTWKATWDNVKRGTWCPTCSKVEAGKKRRLTIEEMQNIAKSRGGKCLSKEYVNISHKLTWECANGHVWDARPSNVKNGKWCPTCARLSRRVK